MAEKSPPNEVVKILKGALAQRRKKNPSYSVRAFARDLDVSPSFVSLVLSGKRTVTLERAKVMASTLRLTKLQTHRLLKAAALTSVTEEGSAGSFLELFSAVGSVQDFTDLDLDRFQYFNHWYHIAILDLSTCSNFKSDVAWISRRLGLDPHIVQVAVDRLLRLGILKNENGQWKKTEAYLNIPNGAPNTILRNFLSQMIIKAQNALEQTAPNDYSRRAITGITFSMAPEHIEAVKARIAQFKREILEMAGNGNCTELYQMNLQFFPLSTGTDES